jgi:class 3 adenylate cyclase
VSDTAGPVENPPAEDPRRENLRLARRLQRLEKAMQQLELLRDTDHRVIKKLEGELHDLLLNILPQTIIDRLNAGEKLIADRFEDLAVVFSDFVGFTEISSRMSAASLVAELNALFSTFDALCEELGVEKIKTIGDAYMAAAGLPGTRADHVVAAAELALAMRDAVRESGAIWRVRIGIDTGPVVAGVMGSRKFVYDLWGDTVNIASRMESNSLPDQIQVSEAVAAGLGDGFELQPRGTIELKGKGLTKTYFLVGRKNRL